MLTLRRWVQTNQALLANTISLVGTTALNSALGFLYWWLAARLFTTEAVGLASAMVSAMMLLGSVGMLGLGTWLIGELPRQTGNAGSLVSTSLLVATTASAGLGIAFALMAPSLTAAFDPLARGVGSAGLFALGVAVTGSTLVLDQALIGLLQGELQWRRNAIFAATKLVALLGTGLWLSKTGLVIYATWLVGNFLSVLYLGIVLVRRGMRPGACAPKRSLLGKLKRSAPVHHVLNLLLQVPGQALPILVTILLTTEANASYYVAWMLASFGFAIPTAFGIVLYALASGTPSGLPSRMRLTIALSLGVGLAVSGLLIVGAGQVLAIFGASYTQSAWCLRFLALGVFPLTIREHYIAICRVHGRVASAAKLMVVGSILELLFAALGGYVGGISGLGFGWLLAVCAEAVLMIRTVHRELTRSKRAAPETCPQGMSKMPYTSR